MTVLFSVDNIQLYVLNYNAKQELKYLLQC